MDISTKLLKIFEALQERSESCSIPHDDPEIVSLYKELTQRIADENSHTLLTPDPNLKHLIDVQKVLSEMMSNKPLLGRPKGKATRPSKKRDLNITNHEP